MFFPIKREFNYLASNTDPSDPAPIGKIFKRREFLNPLTWIVAGHLMQMQRVGYLCSSGRYVVTVDRHEGKYDARLLRIS